MQPDLSRRTALTVAGAGLVLGASGCRVRNPLDQQAAPTPPPADPDVALRDTAREVIGTQLARCRAWADAHPGGRASVTALASLHEAHLGALKTPDGGPSARTAPPVPTATTVRAGEVELQRTLAGLAQRSESGGFARLLASMSASIGQALEASR